MGKKRKRRQKSKRRGTGLGRGKVVDVSTVEGLIDRGMAYLLRDDDLLNAERAFRRALRLVPAGMSPRDVILYNLGTVYARGGRAEEAYEHFQAAIAVNAARPEYWFNLAMSCKHTLRLGRAQRTLEQCLELPMEKALRDLAHEELNAVRGMVAHELSIRPEGFSIDQLIEQSDAFQAGCAAMEAKQWPKAAGLFRQVIGMADVVPQPQGNLGLCLLMMGRYDEAEEALRRALEIEPGYAFAQHNLKMLERTRKEGGKPDSVVMPPAFPNKPPPDLIPDCRRDTASRSTFTTMRVSPVVAAVARP
jgi:tetratricopeptide (TPR) repeat protein